MKFVSRTTPYPPLHAGARPKITGPVLPSIFSRFLSATFAGLQMDISGNAASTTTEALTSIDGSIDGTRETSRELST